MRQWRLIIFLMIMSSCHYYKVIPITSQNVNSHSGNLDKPRTFVLHASDKDLIGYDSKVTNSLIEGDFKNYDSASSLKIYYYPGKSDRIQYGEGSIVEECHIFLNEGLNVDPGYLEVEWKDILEMRLIEKDEQKTMLTFILGWSAFFLAITIIAISGTLNANLGGL